MAMQYWIDESTRTVHLVALGESTPEEWTTAMRAVLKSPAYRAGFGFLSDRRRAATATVPFTENALGFVMMKQKELAGARFAVVVSNPASVEMARMGKDLAERAALPIAAEIFSDVGAAERWLRMTAPDA